MYLIRNLFICFSLSLLTACQQKPAEPKASPPTNIPAVPATNATQVPIVPPPYVLPSGVLQWSIASRLPVAGEARWDYATIDPVARRLYVAHVNEVEVIDLETGKVVGTVPAHDAHGVALIPAKKLGFISNGDAGDVSIFSLSSLEVLTHADAGSGPDAILYEPNSDKILVFNGNSGTACVIDPDKQKELGTIPLNGKPEFAVADGQGKVYVNLEDKNQVLTVDLKEFMLGAHWSLPDGSDPSSLAMDTAGQRLFVGCRNKTLLVLNATTGAVVATEPIGDHVDATVYDPLSHRIFSSCGDGTLFIYHQDSLDAYSLESKVTTLPGARTMAFDAKTGNIYLPATESAPVTALPSGTNGAPVTSTNSAPVAPPASFEILVLGHQP